MYGQRGITLSNIRERVTGLDLFEYYCEPFKSLGRMFCSELRNDKVPSCSVQVIDGKVFYKDFATGDSYDDIGYISAKFNINFLKTLAMINRDFSLGFCTNVSVDTPSMAFFGVPDRGRSLKDLEKKDTYIKTQIRPWNKSHDLPYWNGKYDFTVKQLEYFNIHPLKYFWINERMYSCKGNTYGYYFGKHEGREIWKIYQPLNERVEKWFSNSNKNILQGWDQLPDNGDVLVIASSLKDIVTLRKLGYYAVAPASENTIIDENKINEIKTRFKRIIVFYDNDEPGIKASRKHAELYGAGEMAIPTTFGVKDPSDFVDKYNYEELTKNLKIWMK